MAEIPKYPRRLIEVDLPIRKISQHARREKSIRHGHISTLHIWWARRPLAACRAVVLATLLPDPADQNCPKGFRDAAEENLQRLRENRGGAKKPLIDPEDLRAGLLDFIGEFANWDNTTEATLLEVARQLVHAAHSSLDENSSGRPIVLDPFAGGGSIPLEALRCGADAIASDLNPVAVILNRVTLEYIPRFGLRLADAVREWGAWVREQSLTRLCECFPAILIERSQSHTFGLARCSARGRGAVSVSRCFGVVGWLERATDGLGSILS